MSDEAIVSLEGRRYTPAAYAAGPWDKSMQHGAVPSFVLAHVLETLPAPAPMQVARYTVDLLRPVPMKPLDIATEIIREGRKIQLAQATLSLEGQIVTRAQVLRIRAEDMALPEGRELPPLLPAMREKGEPPTRFKRGDDFNGGTNERYMCVHRADPDHTAFWVRYIRPFIAGVPTSPFMRVAAAMDYSNGLGRPLSSRFYTFLNADNTLNLARPPRGEWLMVEGRQWYGPNSVGFAALRLADEEGYFARSTSSLVLEKRDVPIEKAT